MEADVDMSESLKRKLFWSIIITSMFCTIPAAVRLNFLGSIMGAKLTLYPLLIGVLFSIYDWHKNGKSFSREDKYVVYFLLLYGGVTFISLIHGLAIYPYYNDILNGPMNQIEKLPKAYNLLHRFGIPVDEKMLLGIWLIIRPIKGFILEIFWSFGISYMIYCWYRNHWEEGFSIMRKGLLWCIVIIVLYSILDILYLYGFWGAETVLKFLNPIIHDIKQDGTWWPPLVWPGQLRSIFAEPSYFGIFAAFAMPWLWYSICKEKSYRKKVAMFILFTFYVICLFLTRARTANALFLGELLLFGIASVLFRKELLKNFIILALCAIAALGIASYGIDNFLPGSPEKAQVIFEQRAGHKPVNKPTNKPVNVSGYMADNLGSLASADKRSNRSRYSILKANIGIGMDYPVLGVGLGLRHAYIPEYLPKEAFLVSEIQMWIRNQKEKGIMRSGFPSLGEYSSRFAETGILGLIVYLIPAFFLIYRLLAVICNKAVGSPKRIPYVFFLISILGVLASGLGDSINITYAYWLLLGLGYAMCFGKKTISALKSD